jgi:steroid 5-alpha reductase family enzyme
MPYFASTVGVVASSSTVLIAALVTIACLMLATWSVSLVRRDASIVDIAWGLGFVLCGWAALFVTGASGSGNWLLVVMVSVWGLRLAGYLAKRNLGKGEDFRYRAMRRKHGERFAIVSLYTVFALQGALMFVVALPVTLGQRDVDASIGFVSFIGFAVWVVGLYFEVVGDAQLARFKRDPRNADRIMDRGLWALTRHPNYFGDSLVWWGLAIVGSSQGAGPWAFLGAAVMTVLLVRVSGAAMLDRLLAQRKPGYAEYMQRTSGFIPLPKRPASAREGRMARPNRRSPRREATQSSRPPTRAASDERGPRRGSPPADFDATR